VNEVKQPTVFCPLIALLYFLYHNLIYIGTKKGYIMAKNTSITLGDHFDQFINQQLKTGRYGSASEIVRAGLRALEDQETKLLNLRNMLIQGEKSGITDYSYKNLLTELDKTTTNE
jgi:antitoxin ParD1/3/4